MILRSLVVAFCGLLAFSVGARAQAIHPCAVQMPFTFVNGQVADANQVNTNFSTLLACSNNNGRVPINSALTLYVSPTGSDANNSCLNPISPCLTGKNAIANLFSFYMFVDAIQVATISYAAGVYTQSLQVGGTVPGQQQPTQIIFQGNTGSPDSVSITGDNTQQAAFDIVGGALVTIQGFKLAGPNGDCIRVRDASVAAVSSIDFATAVTAHMHVKYGGVIHTTGSYQISGGAFRHIWGDGPSTVQWYNAEIVNPCCTYTGITVTLTGTPAFGGAFLKLRFGYADAANIIFSGAATGRQCDIQDNGTLVTGTAGALVLPGTTSTCTPLTGGIFD